MAYLTSTTPERGGARSCLVFTLVFLGVVGPWFVGCYQLWEWIT